VESVVGDWPAPRQVLGFADGGSLEIYEPSVGELVASRSWTPAGPVKERLGMLGELSISSHLSTGLSSTYAGSYYTAKSEEKSEDGHLVFCRYAVDGFEPLFVPLRLLDADGKAVEIPMWLAFDEVEGRRGGGDRLHLGRVGSNAEEHSSALRGAGLKLLVQHKDPVSGWVNLDGPVLLSRNLDGRYGVMLFAWQRDQRVLEFRAIREDGEEVAFQVRNPAYQGAPQPLVRVPERTVGADFEAEMV